MKNMSNVPEYFGCMVFNETVMKERLPKDIYAQIIERIEMQIISGYYKPGDRLPSVREFASEAGVNPNTMQKALGELERKQLIITQRTNGKVVTEDFSMIEDVKKQFASEQIKMFLQKMNELGIGKEETIARVKVGIELLSK